MTINLIKLGGAITGQALDLPALQAFIQKNPHTILVHGGGNLVSEFSQQLGLPVTKIGGRRVTDAPTLQVMVMACAGWINKEMVSSLQQADLNALGLCGADGALLRGRRRAPLNGIDYGLVGEIEQVNTQLLASLLSAGLLPVVAPVVWSQEHGLLNTNADTVAAGIAAALAAQGHDITAWFLMEAAGVYDNNGGVIPRLNPVLIDELAASGALSDGILPKIENAMSLARQQVQRVVLGNFSVLEDAGRGTIITA